MSHRLLPAASLVVVLALLVVLPPSTLAAATEPATPSVTGTVTASARGVNSVTLPPLQASCGATALLVVSLRDAKRSVRTVEGGDWHLLARQGGPDVGRAQELWLGSPHDGASTVRITGRGDVAAQLLCLSHGAVSAFVQADSGGSPSLTPLTTLPTQQPRTLVIGVVTSEGAPIVPLDAWTANALNTGPKAVPLATSTFVRSFDADDVAAVSGTFATANLWIAGAVAFTHDPSASVPPADDPPADDPPADDPPADDPPADDPPAEVPGADVAPAYSTFSPWNTPIAADAPVHPDSQAFVQRIQTARSDGHLRQLTSDPLQYTYPLYRVDQATPLRTISLSGVYSEVLDEATTRRRSAPTLQVPIPPDARPSAGTDASVIIWDPATGEEWGFWQFADNGDGTFSATNGYRYSTRWLGVPPSAPDRFMSRGAGLPYLAGLVRRDEMDAGRIDHALAFAYDYPSPEHVWPATKSDGWGQIDLDVPEGARLQLDPRYTEADFAAWGLSREGRIMARALQTYGMYVIDRAGRPKVMIEDELTGRWNGTVTAATLSPIPWTAFRVLDWRAPLPPIPVLGAARTVAPGAVVTLDGSRSYDPDGTITDYQWTAPAGAVLEGASTATPRWDTAGMPHGTHTVSLRVRDNTGTWSAFAAATTITIETPTVPVVLEQQELGTTYADTATGPSWQPLAAEHVLAIVALRPARTTVSTVTGNGLTWTRVLRHADTQGELAVEVWRATGSSPTRGPVTVTTATDAWALNAQTLRLTPATLTSVASADTGPVDTRYPSVAVPTPAGPSVALGVHVGRATPFTLHDGLTEIARSSVGEAGNTVRMTLMSAESDSATTRVLGGTQSSSLDWVMGGLVLEPLALVSAGW
jgi:hypothetical protein